MPRVFISYSHDSPLHGNRVLALSNRLRHDGIDCRIDQYEQSPEEGWPKWCNRQVRESEIVLVACTETYLRRFDGDELPGTGRGGTWEGHIITQELYNSQGRNKKFVPIVFSKEDHAFVPLILQGATIYQFPDQYPSLYSHLTGQHLHPMPELGKKAVHAIGRNQPNPFFTGREQILADVKQLLDQQKRVALSGLGGTGKTQTAIEYAFRHRDEYNSIFWVRAETRDTLLADFAAIASALDLPSAQEKEQDLAVQEAKRWLETHSAWLLVFDNVEDLGLVREFLPPNAKGHVLLTTQRHALGGLAERVNVPKMQPEEAVQLLLRRSKAADNESNRSAARQIAHELGYLPLALDQAGAFIEETPSSLSEYLSFFYTQRDKILAERGSLGDHPSVMVTFSLAFEKVAAISTEAADLIRVCAFLAPDAIPEEIFTPERSMEFLKLVEQATRFSLLDRDPETRTLDIHRLLQAGVRAGMSEAEQRAWAERAVRAMNVTFPNPKFEDWGLCQRLLPHAQLCAKLIGEWNFEFEDAGRLLNEVASYLKQRAYFSEAELLYCRAMSIGEKALGPNHYHVTSILNNLAVLYLDQEKYTQAESLLQRALEIRENSLGAAHPEVAISLNNLAALYDRKGKYAEAESLLQRALEIRENSLGAAHPKVAVSLNNLAALYDGQGKYGEAEPLYRRSLAIRETALTPDHPDVANTLNNLAVLYRNQSRHAEALPLFQRAVTICENALGPDHPKTVLTRANLEDCLRALNSPKTSNPS